MSNAAADFLISQFEKIPVGKQYMLPSEFAEKTRAFPKELSPFPGPFSYKRFPYFREIADSFHHKNPAREIVLMKGNQMGSNASVLETVILYNIMEEPKPQFFVTADASLMKTGVNTRIENMIDSSGARAYIFSQSGKNKGARNTGDTANAKEYLGGFLHFYGARNPNKFRQNSYMAALADEVDAYKEIVKDEGSVVSLIRYRTDAWPLKRKIYWASTPKIEQTSIIYRLYKEGDQRRYKVPCVHCGQYQSLVWHGVKENGEKFGIVWENDEKFKPITADAEKGRASTVRYKCKHCGGLMQNHDKETIMGKGYWEPRAESQRPGLISFHISPLYNPPGMLSWDDIVREWALAWDLEKNRLRDKDIYRTFRNTKQGLPFLEKTENLKYERTTMFKRHGFIRGTVPNDLSVEYAGGPVLVLIAGVDIQREAIYVDVKGYSSGGVTWTVDAFVIDKRGPTNQMGGPWDELYKFFAEKIYEGTDGKRYRVQCAFIDSGYSTEWVYAFAQRFGGSRIYACKGQDTLGQGETYKLFNKDTLRRIGLQEAYLVNTQKLKDKINSGFTALRWDEGRLQPGWFPNFPDDFKDDYFRHFEAEERVEKRTRWGAWRGFAWRPVYHGAANHFFDTYAYNLAALEMFAEAVCNGAGVAMSWEAFWLIASGTGAFYFEKPKPQPQGE